MENINPEKLLLKIVPILDNLKIDYFITGGYAVSVWGRPRSTFDIDIVIKMIEPKLGQLISAIRRISKDGYINEDVAKYASIHKGEFNFIDPDTGLKIDFWVSKDDKKSKEQYDRRIAKKIKNKKIYFISPEDLIINKLIWYKETDSDRHLEDIESILKNSKMNFEYLKKQARNYKLLKILDKI